MSFPTVVLVRPRNHDNLVAIAGAMKTFGLTRWIVVSKAAFLDPLLVRARERAGVQLSPERVDTLKEAIDGFELVVGTTMRALPGRPRFTARELARSCAHSELRWALVFGTETNGLTDQDLRWCNALAYLPTEPEQPSVNLAQALLLFAHELFTARAAPASMADPKTLRRLGEQLAQRVREGGLPRRVADELVAPLVRGQLSASAAALLARWASR